MSLTENEILAKYVDALGVGRDMCHMLARNADPDKIAPRGQQYGNLRRALRDLEGCCRQMNYMREDTRWVKLGVMYARAMQVAFKLYSKQNWMEIGKLAGLFVDGLRRMQDLANMKTGKRGVILPQRPSDWLILPDRPLPGIQRGLIH